MQKGPTLADFSLIFLDGKRPIDKRWQRYCSEKSPVSPKELNGRNCGVTCGPASGCIVLDIDDADAFTSTCEKHDWHVPETYTIETGSGGHHYYFLYPQDGRKYGNLARKAMGFDVRGHGGQVVAAGSIHPDTGKPYIVLHDIPMVKPPQWLLGLYKPAAKPKSAPKSNRRLSADNLERLPIKPETRSLIRNGAAKGRRSEAVMAVLSALVWSNLSDLEIFSIFEAYPIGQKYLEKGSGREKWLQPQIDKARAYVTNRAEDPKSPDVPNKRDSGQSISDEQLLKEYRKIDEPNSEQIQAAKAAVVRILNKEFAAVLIDGKFVVVLEYIDPVTDRADISYIRKQDFLSLYENKSIITGYSRGKPAFSTWAQIWIKSSQRREYKGVTFDTRATSSSDYLNLYKPPILKTGPGTCELYLDHVKNIICSGASDITTWVLDWLAWIVQDKGRHRSGTAIVLHGSQGTGKGTFADPFLQIFGSHSLHLTQQVHLAGRFGEHFKSCIIAFADEALWAGDKKSEGHLKALITESHILVEPKFMGAFPIRNHVNLIFASNSNWIVPTGLEERRFLALHVSSDRQRDYEYFSKIKKQMSTGGVADLARFLADRKITSNLREAPRTAEFLSQVIESMEPEQHFWFDLLKSGEMYDPEEDIRSETTWPELISRSGIYTLYCRYCERINMRNRLLTPSQFGGRFREMANTYGGPRKAFTFGGKRFQTYRMPPLDIARAKFEEKIKYKVAWDDDDETPF